MLACLKVDFQNFNVGIEENFENHTAENIRQCIV